MMLSPSRSQRVQERKKRRKIKSDFIKEWMNLEVSNSHIRIKINLINRVKIMILNFIQISINKYNNSYFNRIQIDILQI